MGLEPTIFWLLAEHVSFYGPKSDALSIRPRGQVRSMTRKNELCAEIAYFRSHKSQCVFHFQQHVYKLK